MTAATSFLAGLALVGVGVLMFEASDSAPLDPRIASTSVAEICRSDGLPGSAYSRAHRRHVWPKTPGYIHDHIIPLCLGGADVEANIQLQTPEDAKAKDEIEWNACRQVCNHGADLGAWQRYFLTAPWKDVVRGPGAAR